MKQSANPLFTKWNWISNTLWYLIMHWHVVHGHATDARPRDDVPKVSIKDQKFLFHTSECRGKHIQLQSSCDAINLHACLKRARDHDLAICIYMQGRYIRDQDNPPWSANNLSSLNLSSLPILQILDHNWYTRCREEASLLESASAWTVTSWRQC